MISNAKLIDDLIKAAYDSGYYSGKREDGQPHHLAAMERRGQLRDEALQRLAALPDLLAALEMVRDTAKAPENRGAMTQLQMCGFLDDLLTEIELALATAEAK